MPAYRATSVFGIGHAMTALSLAAIVACSGTAIGTRDDLNASDLSAPDQPSSPPEEIVDPDGGGSAIDGGAPTAPPSGNVTVIVDGYPGTVMAPSAAITSGTLTASVAFSSPTFAAEIELDVAHTGKGCGYETYDNFIAMVGADDGTVFTSDLEGTACNLVVTSVGARLVGSFQGALVQGGSTEAGPAAKHTIALSFDIPIAR